MNLSNKKPQSRPPKSIDDGDLVNYCQQSINFYHHPSESSKNQSIENDEFQRHFIYNNQNRGEILNNIDSSDSSDLSDFEVEIKPHIAVQKKDRDIHDQKKTKISQQNKKHLQHLYPYQALPLHAQTNSHISSTIYSPQIFRKVPL